MNSLHKQFRLYHMVAERCSILRELVSRILLCLTRESIESPIECASSGATVPGQSGPGSKGNKGVPRIPQSSSITGTSPSDCWVKYPGNSLGWRYPAAKMQSMYSTAPFNCRYIYTLFEQVLLKTMTTKSMVESAWAEDMWQLLYRLDPDTRKIQGVLKK